MSLISDLAEGGAKGLFDGLGGLAKDLRSAITGKLPPEQEAEIQAKLVELEFAAQKAQTEINLTEASNPRLFISGWRPFLGWICGIAFSYQFLARPLLGWASGIYDFPLPPTLDMGDLLTVLGGLLGLGSLRTIEKLKGVANK